jgi:hypothetical protein
MSNTTYQWQINKLECLPTEQQIVYRVYWAFIATRNNVSVNSIGSIDLNYDEIDEEEFIEYSDLTEEIVLNWTKEHIDLYQEWNNEENLKIALNNELDAIENQNLIYPELPWSESRE